jgi:hypothetical protein
VSAIMPTVSFAASAAMSGCNARDS